MIPACPRSYLVFDIRARTRRQDIAMARATDFETTLVSAAADLGPLDGLLPYCLDVAAERVIYTDTPDIPGTLAAPFLYQAQFANAQRLVSVPFERLLELETAVPTAPTIVFSVGRCGSTLLASLLRHAGRPSASEPDVYSQIAVMSGNERIRVGHAARMALIRGCTAALARQIGADVVIKLRGQCNSIAGMMAAAVPEARVAFMLRDRLAWAHSRRRVFRNPPQMLAEILKQGVMAYDTLVRAGHRPILIWYEDLIADVPGTLSRLGVPGEALGRGGPGGLQALLSHDAQEGTSISRQNTQRELLPDAAVAEFEAAWAAIAPREVIRRHRIERLLPSGD